MHAGYVRRMLKNAPRLAVSGSVAKVQVRAAHFGSLVSSVTVYSDWNNRVKQGVWLVHTYRVVTLVWLHAGCLARLWIAIQHTVTLLKMKLVNLGYILLEIILKLGVIILLNIVIIKVVMHWLYYIINRMTFSLVTLNCFS